MTTSRDAILADLRAGRPDSMDLPPIPADREVFADWPGTRREDLCRQFATQLERLKGVVRVVPDRRTAAACVERLVPPSQRALLQPDRWLGDVVGMAPGLDARLSPLPEQLDSAEMAGYDAAVTGADWLIARTGSIVILSACDSGRRLSVLPPLHVVVASADRLVPSWDEALAKLGADGRSWSSVSFISGPSRTADIEKILVLGAHGPKRLEVILVQETEEPQSTGDRP